LEKAQHFGVRIRLVIQGRDNVLQFLLILFLYLAELLFQKTQEPIHQSITYQLIYISLTKHL
jgi:hypothetical protein